MHNDFPILSSTTGRVRVVVPSLHGRLDVALLSCYLGFVLRVRKLAPAAMALSLQIAKGLCYEA
jgi:hypothetical protein